MRLFTLMLTAVLVAPCGAQEPSPQKQKQAQARQAELRESFAREHPPRDSTGMVPLTDLGKGEYKGETGGLYPGGSNTPPAAHARAGMEAARRIVPLDSEGRPADSGRVVMVSTGMSNTTQESQAFAQA